MAGDSHIKRTFFGFGGSIIVYRCDHCAANLKSPLDEAGTSDICPACGAAFIVPGAAERDRLRNDKIENEEAKNALVESKHKEETDTVSNEALPPNQFDTSLPLS